jgi:hypothetical protein
MKSIKFLIGMVAFTVMVVGCTQEQDIPSTPEEALQKFYKNMGAEDQLMDPLILGGKKVVPLVLNDIKNKNMERRRYAIGALGNIKDETAIPFLKIILEDKTEESYFRCDALNSIALINFSEGKNLAKNHQNSSVKCLSEISHEVINTEQQKWEEENYMRRTYQQALSGRHD